MTYAEEPWEPVWEYKLNSTFSYIEVFEIKENNEVV
jgi:hypothetical protein